VLERREKATMDVEHDVEGPPLNAIRRLALLKGHWAEKLHVGQAWLMAILHPSNHAANYLDAEGARSDDEPSSPESAPGPVKLAKRSYVLYGRCPYDLHLHVEPPPQPKEKEAKRNFKKKADTMRPKSAAAIRLGL